MATASDMAEGDMRTGGDMGFQWLVDISGSVKGCGDRLGVRLIEWVPSGLPEREVPAGGIEERDTRLPREELLEMAEAGVMVRGIEVLTYCLGLNLANALACEV
jgi:hypothetical protein